MASASRASFAAASLSNSSLKPLQAVSRSDREALSALMISSRPSMAILSSLFSASVSASCRLRFISSRALTLVSSKSVLNFTFFSIASKDFFIASNCAILWLSHFWWTDRRNLINSDWRQICQRRDFVWAFFDPRWFPKIFAPPGVLLGIQTLGEVSHCTKLIYSYSNLITNTLLDYLF